MISVAIVASLIISSASMVDSVASSLPGSVELGSNEVASDDSLSADVGSDDDATVETSNSSIVEI